MDSYYAHGKLLLSGEYVVLDGAKALAIPTRLGQYLEVTPSNALGLEWASLNHEGQAWLEARLGAQGDDQIKLGEEAYLQRLRQIIDAIIVLRPAAEEQFRACSITTRLEFDRQWGLGSSSTLIAMLAQYAEVNPYELLANTFGGSGYDLACAIAKGPISFQWEDDFGLPQVSPLNWQPAWLEQTYFVYLGQKQNSREGIHHYRQQEVKAADIAAVSQLSDDLLEAAGPAEVQKILHEHEALVGQLTKQAPVQERLFPDFPGQLKSLGAWGGDFIWAISELPEADVKSYFFGKGLEVVLPYHELAL